MSFNKILLVLVALISGSIQGKDTGLNILKDMSWGGRDLLYSLHEGDRDGYIGIELLYFDERDLTPDKVAAMLSRTGFVRTAPEELLQGWKQTINDVNYIVILTDPCGNAGIGKEIFQQTEDFAAHGTPKLEIIRLHLVCNDHRWNAICWMDGYDNLLNGLQREHGGWIFKGSSGHAPKFPPAATASDTPSYAPAPQSPFDRFTNFLHEEKIPLGLMAFSLLTLTMSSR